MATHRFNRDSNRMEQVEAGAVHDVRTSFALLRDGQIIFDGNAAELACSTDPYIRGYVA